MTLRAILSTATLLLLINSLLAQTEAEPNGSFSQATPISANTTTSGFIQSEQDEDYYSVNLTQAGIITVRINSVPGNINLRAFFYNTDQEVIFTDVGNNGQNFTFDVSVCEPGNYFLYLDDGNSFGNNQGNDFNTNEAYNFNIDFVPLAPLDPCECENEFFSQACLINTGEEISAIIAPWFDNSPTTYDVDYYRFNVTEPGIIRFSLGQVPGNLNLRAFVYGPDQVVIANEVGNNGQIFNFEVSTCSLGEHYLYISDANSFGNNIGNDFNFEEQYTFTIDFTSLAPLDDCECENESFSQACLINAGEENSALIVPWFDNSPTTYDVDFYRFNVTEPGIIRFSLGQVPGNLNLRAFVYGPDQVVIGNEAGNNGQAFTFEVSTCSLGEHYLYISDANSFANNIGNDFNAEEQYTFTVDFTPFTPVDECECENESFTQACEIAIGQEVTALIAPWFDNSPTIYDRDYYRFNISEPGVIEFNLTNTPSNIDLRVFLYDDNQNLIFSRRGNLGQSFSFNVSTCGSGNYYLYISDSNSSGNNIGSSFNADETYNFSVGLTPFSEIDPFECNNSLGTATQINTCETIQATFGAAFGSSINDIDSDYYAVELMGGTVATFYVDEIDSQVAPAIQLFNPAGQNIAVVQTQAGVPIAADYNIPQTGTYTVRLLNNLTGNLGLIKPYSFSVNCPIISSTKRYVSLAPNQLYPNPANNLIHLDLSGQTLLGAHILFRSATGAVVLEQKVATTRQQIDISSLLPGIYFVEVRTNDTLFTAKLMKR